MNTDTLVKAYAHAGFRLVAHNYQPFELYPADPEGRMIVWFNTYLQAVSWLDGYLYALEQREVTP